MSDSRHVLHFWLSAELRSSSSPTKTLGYPSSTNNGPRAFKLPTMSVIPARRAHLRSNSNAHEQLYLSVLASLSILLRPASPAQITISRQLSIVLLSTGIVYGYRDLWPFATSNLSPEDAAYGWMTWSRVAITLFAGVILPLITPRVYIPLDPKVGGFRVSCLRLEYLASIRARQGTDRSIEPAAVPRIPIRRIWSKRPLHWRSFSSRDWTP